MILEKIKENSGKILFFVINVLLIVTGVLHVKQRKIQDAMIENNESIANTPALAVDVQALQKDIAADRQQKIESIANNPAVVIKQETVAVTKIIPGATRTVTVSAGTTTSGSTKKTSSTPAKSTKTS